MINYLIRFSQTSSSQTPCPDIHTYCGGTWKGIINHLSYIQNMGFDAIWISPVVANTPGGYHGKILREKNIIIIIIIPRA